MNSITYKIIYYTTSVIEFFLGLRFILKLLAANAGVPFVQWIYSVGGALLTPFQGIFPATAQGGSIFESSTLFALLIYGFVGYLLLGWASLRYPYVCDEVTGICKKVEA